MVRPASATVWGNLFEVAGREHANALNGGWEMGRDGGDLSGCDLALAGGKDEAYGVPAEVGGHYGVFKGGVGADFDPHGVEIPFWCNRDGAP